MNYQRTTFSKIKHLLPPDAWAVWRNEQHKGEFEAESVLVFDMAAELDELNLDTPFDEAEVVFLLLVKGDLTVRKFIYNEDTDGAAGLVVLGNLRAGNMLVGGQEIYVTGNLVVEELFWGDYNHGDLRVLGNATAAVFAATDYGVDVRGQTKWGINLTPAEETAEVNWLGLDVALTEATLVEELLVFNPDPEEGLTLGRDEAVVSRLQAGQSLLKNLPF